MYISTAPVCVFGAILWYIPILSTNAHANRLTFYPLIPFLEVSVDLPLNLNKDLSLPNL